MVKLVVVVVLLVVFEQQIGKTNALVKDNYSDVVRLPQSKGNCSVGATFTCKDCMTLLLCNRNGEEITTQSCVTPNPYCFDGKCVSDMPPNCAAPNHTFSCTSDGYFPDPHDCSKYYYCLDKQIDKAYTCPDGWYVDTFSFTCKRLSDPKLNCTLPCQANQIAVHPINKKYFGFCNKQNEIEMFACKENYEYILNIGCNYKCESEGYYPGETPEKFVLCIKTGTTFNYKEYDCPTGMTFDITKKFCVSEI